MNYAITKWPPNQLKCFWEIIDLTFHFIPCPVSMLALDWLTSVGDRYPTVLTSAWGICDVIFFRPRVASASRPITRQDDHFSLDDISKINVMIIRPELRQRFKHGVNTLSLFFLTLIPHLHPVLSRSDAVAILSSNGAQLSMKVALPLA